MPIYQLRVKEPGQSPGRESLVRYSRLRIGSTSGREAGTNCSPLPARCLCKRCFGGQASGYRVVVLRALAIGIAIAVVVFVVSGGHFIFLPLILLPLGVFSFGAGRRKQRRRTFWL
jgi:hypothetical protein